MRLPINPRLPEENVGLVRLLSDVIQQVNGVNEGRMNVRHAATTAAPTTGSWAQGDIVLNSTPSELGSSPNKYVITQFVCVVSGTPGTWVQARSLTGN